MRIRIVASSAVIGLLCVALPVRLPHPAAGPARSACLSLSDSPPDRTQPDLLQLLEQCSALNPGDVVLMADLAAQYESLGRLSSAEAAYRHALAIDPAYADLRLRLGRLLLRRGDLSAAHRQAQAALKVQPNRQALLDLLRDTKASPLTRAEGESVQ